MLILASKSPRRTEIFNEFQIAHTVIPSGAEEVYDPELSIEKIPEAISKLKALDVAQDYPKDLVIGVDTVVVLGSTILGKPKNQQEAFQMISALAGNTHRVISGVTIIQDGRVKQFHDTTFVTFAPMTDEEILTYIQSENVLDKAGAYAIQSPNAWFVKGINGSYFNVVGMPIEKLMPYVKNYKS